MQIEGVTVHALFCKGGIWLHKTLEKQTVKERNYAVDLIKITAFCLVVTVHFFLHTDYYNTPLIGVKMFFLTNIRNLAMTCVPLFIIATGYLMSEKKWSKRYYWGAVRTVVTLVITEIICCLYDSRVFADKPFWKQIFQMGTSHYSWYIDMYVGLFLIIPFLNLAYKNLDSQKEKQRLVISFAAITMLIPSVFSLFKLEQGWWDIAYPLGYYYIGCYLKEYGIKIKGVYCALTAIASAVIMSSAHFAVCYNHTMLQSLCITNYNSVFVAVMSVAIFSLILKTNDALKNKSFLNKAVSRLSGLTLGAYLISYVIDDIVYDIAYYYYDVDGHKLTAFPIIVITVIFCSLCLSYFINLFVDGIMYFVNKFKKA